MTHNRFQYSSKVNLLMSIFILSRECSCEITSFTLGNAIHFLAKSFAKIFQGNPSTLFRGITRCTGPRMSQRFPCSILYGTQGLTREKRGNTLLISRSGGSSCGKRGTSRYKRGTSRRDFGLVMKMLYSLKRNRNSFTLTLPSKSTSM